MTERSPQPAKPVWVLQPVGLLALCPLLAAGGTLLTASCIALLFLGTLTLVSVTLAMLGRCVSSESRILALLLVSGMWVTLLDLLLQALVFPLWATLGIYLPLIASNSLLLAVGEQSLRRGGGNFAVQAEIRLGSCCALWIIPLGLVREILGTGALLSDSQLLPGLPDPLVITSFTAPLLQTAPGTLLVLALAGAWAARRASARL